MEKTVNIRSGLWLFVVSMITCVVGAYFCYHSSMQNAFNTVFTYKFGSSISAIISAYLLLTFLPLPVEQHWLDKVRIGVVLTFGATVIGIFCWPLIAPHVDRMPVAFYNSAISITDALIILPVAFATGAAAYFLGWPDGRHTALAAVPMGIGVWGLRCGSLANLLAYNNELPLRHNIYMSLRWEGIFWLLVVAAGYLGVRAAAALCNDNTPWEQEQKKPQAGDIILPLVVTSSIAWLLINILAQSPKLPTSEYGTIYSQPRNAQIAFALLTAFGVAGYASKRFMKVRFEIPLASTALVSLGAAIYSGKESMQSISMNLPAHFYAHPICAILPVQTIAFGTLGVLIGYSIAILGNHKKLLLENDAQVTK